MTSNDDLNLLLAFIRGELRAAEVQKLEARLAAEPRLARQLMQIAHDEVALADWAQVENQVTKIDQVNAQLHPKLSASSEAVPSVPASGIPVTSPLPEIFPQSAEPSFPLSSDQPSGSSIAAPATRWAFLPSSGFWSWIVIALGFACSLMIGFWLWPSNNLGRGKVIASIQGLEDAQWRKTNDTIQIGAGICEGYDFELVAGKVDIVYPHGATLHISGPAKWKMVNLESSLLESGKMTAYVPPTAVGYRVQTPVLSVLDKGTRFGVQVNEDRDTEVHVFEGEVEAHSLRGPTAKVSPQPILMTQAVRYDANGKLKEWIQPAYETFQSTNLVPGIVRTSQNIRWTAQPPASLQQNRLTHDDNMLLILERENIALPGPIAATFKMPAGGTRSGYDTNITMLPKGLRVDSYLLHYNSAGRKKPVQGDIQFTRPIIAVIARGDQLVRTDHILGRKGIRYEENPAIRGLKAGTPGTSAPDVLNLGHGPNRINVWCEAGRNTVAELRILVEAEPDNGEGSQQIDIKQQPVENVEIF
jgi:hypothetical protein